MAKTKAEHEAEQAKKADLHKRIEDHKQADKDREKRIYDAWPDDVPFYMIHGSELYGRQGSVKLAREEGNRYSSSEPDDRFTLDRIADLLDRFPPILMTWVNDGCLAWKTKASAEAEYKERQEHTDAWGVRIQVDWSDHGGLSQVVEWVTELAPGLFVEIEAPLLPASFPIDTRINVRRDRSTGTAVELKQAECQAKNGFFMDRRTNWSRCGTISASWSIWWQSPEWHFPPEKGGGGPRSLEDTPGDCWRYVCGKFLDTERETRAEKESV